MNNHTLPHKCDNQLRRLVISRLLEQQENKQTIISDFEEGE